MKLHHERIPLLPVTRQNVVKVTKPLKTKVRIDVIKELQSDLAFGLKINDIVFSNHRKCQLNWSVFILAALSLFGAGIAAGLSLVEIPGAKYKRDAYISNHNFNVNYYPTYLSRKKISRSEWKNTFEALNESDCLSHLLSNECELRIDCNFYFDTPLREAYQFTNPKNCELNYFNDSLQLDIRLYNKSVLGWDRCPWSCHTQIVTQYEKNLTNIHRVCDLPSEENVDIKMFLKDCKGLAPLNSQLDFKENYYMLVKLLTFSLSTTFGFTVLFLIIHWLARTHKNDQQIYLTSYRKYDLNKITEEIMTLKSNTVDHKDSGFNWINNLLDSSINSIIPIIPKIDPVKYISLYKMDSTSVPIFLHSMTELVKLGNWLSAIQARKKEMVKTLLQGSHRVNLTTKGRHPFTLFSSVDESGDMRNLIFNYAGLGPVYRKKCK